MRVLVGKFVVFCVQVSCVLQMVGESFSEPKEFSNFESNLGDQRLVDVVRPWVGVTPKEPVELPEDITYLLNITGEPYR